MSSRFLIPVVVAALNATAGAQLCFEDRSVPLPAGTIALTHADMDGDGDVDLVVGYLHGSFSVFLNDGAGNFIESAQYPLGPDVYGMAAGDLNGDGKADVVTASALSPNSISVFYNSGNGLLSAAVPLPAPGYPSSMAVVDMDGDSDNDIVVVGYWGASVWVLRNGGSGTFGTYDTHPALAGAQGLAVGDLSGDGLPDLVVGDGDSDRISVYLSSPSGLSAQFTYPTGPGPYYPAIGDFDGDGQADVAVADFNGNLHPGNIRIFHNTGGGILNSQADIPTGVIGPICIGTSDFDADGDVDIAATTYFGSDVVILENDGAGAFPRRTLAHAGDDLYGMTIADFNGDGKPDVAASAWGASPPRAAVFLQCPGSPSPGLCLDDTSVPVVAGPVAITDADMDLDGDLDLVVGYLHGDFSVFMNDGDGGFAAERHLSARAGHLRGRRWRPQRGRLSRHRLRLRPQPEHGFRLLQPRRRSPRAGGRTGLAGLPEQHGGGRHGRRHPQRHRRGGLLGRPRLGHQEPRGRELRRAKQLRRPGPPARARGRRP